MQRPLRIALDVSPLYQSVTSGIATYLLELVKHLPLVAGSEHFLWFYCAPWGSGRRLPPSGISARVPPLPPRLLRLGWRHLRWPSVRSLLSNPDVYHASHIWQPPLGRARGIVTIHDLTPLIMPDVHTQANVEAHVHLLRFAREEAAGILVDSQATLHDLLALAPEVESRARVVPLAASCEFQPVTDPHELARMLVPLGLAERPYFLFTGTIEPRKNVGRLLAAFRSLDMADLNEPSLVLAGPPGWGEASVLQEAERLGIRDRVTVTGPVPRQTLRYLMAGAVALVYPSLYEGFGIPPLEAMSCGTPVITSAVSSLPEVVGDAALLVDPLQSDEIAQAMLQIVQDSALRADLIQRGLRRAAQFSWKSTAQQTLDFYHWVFSAA